MKVNCVVLKLLHNKITFDTIYKLMGTNIPRYLPYEGGTGCNCLFCIDATIDIRQICLQHDVTIGTFYEMEIDENLYNDQYTIYPTYDKNREPFVLEKNDKLSRLW